MSFKILFQDEPSQIWKFEKPIGAVTNFLIFRRLENGYTFVFPGEFNIFDSGFIELKFSEPISGYIVLHFDVEEINL